MGIVSACSECIIDSHRQGDLMADLIADIGSRDLPDPVGGISAWMPDICLN